MALQTAKRAATVEIVVPARNEEASLGRCLESLAMQQGIAFAITVVNDGSTDRTRAIAESFPAVRVIDAQEPPPGWSGKCNALIQGTEGATATWLLFTDADTFHYPGSLAAAVDEAELLRVDMLSYSPEQEIVSWGERSLMPVIFADLVLTYPSARVNDPQDPMAAVNGQYLLVRREVYEALGGHHAVATNILEDVALARFFKAANHRIWFRHGSGLVRTRMYRNFALLAEGWTKNLALLFHRPLALAGLRAVEFSGVFLLLAAGAVFLADQKFALGIALPSLAGCIYGMFLWRIRRAHFAAANLLAFFGLPLFSWLLLRSWLRSRPGRGVTWKGRAYANSASPRARRASNRGRCKVEI